MTDFQKTRMNLKITIDIDEQLTWAELFRFVDLAKPVVSLDDTVGIEWEQNSMQPEGLYVYVPNDLLATATDGDADPA